MSDVGEYKIQRDIQRVLAEQIASAKEEVIKLAVKEFEHRIREVCAKTSINLANYYSVERMGANLLITVKMEEPRPSAPDAKGEQE